MEPPSFPNTALQTVRAAPASNATLLLPVPTGTPPFHYEWNRAGAILDGRFKTSVDSGGVRLTVTAAQTADSGVYTLQASNVAGRDTTRVQLEVSPDETPTGDDPPAFLRRLQDLTVKVGTRTRFLVEIVSSTECKVTWYRNERRLLEVERIALVRDGNFWCADVSAVSVDDAGRWTCTAENLGGRASCSAHLNVLVPKAYKRPEFVEELRAILTEQGTVSLECKVVGVPTPVLRWFKDSREIKAGDVFALTANAEDPTSLGTYTCEAVNCMGRAYSSSKVHVVGRASGEHQSSARPTSGGVSPDPPPIFTKELEDQFVKICEQLTFSCHMVVPPWPRSVVWYNKEGKIESNDKYRTIEDGVGGYLVEVSTAEWCDEGEWKCVTTSSGGRIGISTCYVTMEVPKNYRKPRFMENLQAVLTDEGLVSFECKVVGFPTPVLSWFKDGQELKPGDVYQLTGTNSLGSYCCIAKNCMGQASSSAELTVEDIQNQLNEEEKLQLFSKNQAPKFKQGLKSVEAKIDEPFRFTIKVAIPPEPTVLWYRDDQPVDKSSRCHLGREDRGVFYLNIKNLELMDQTEWKCVAMNDFGHSVTSCFLKLIIPRHFKKPRFLENLQAILSEEGAVNLECKVIGVPQPVLKWYKDGEELKPGDIHRIISGQDGTCCLGTYTCEAQNCMGIAASSASLLGFEDTVKAKNKKKAEEQALERNLSLSTIHEERTSQLYDTPIGDITLDDKGEISFSFDGKEVSVSLYETPDLTEEEALQIVEMYADQLSENVTEHNVVELPPLRFVKETSTSGNLLMEAIIIDVSPDYFINPEEDLRTEADIEDISIADENGPAQLSFDLEVGDDYLEKTIALLSEEKSDIPKKINRRKSDSQRSGDYYSISREQSLSEGKKDDDTALSESTSFASAHSASKQKSKSSKPSQDDGQESSDVTRTVLFKEDFGDVIHPQDEIIENQCVEITQIRGKKISIDAQSTSIEKLAVAKEDSTLTTSNITENVSNIVALLLKSIQKLKTVEEDTVLKAEAMSSAATASKSLEVINSIITPLAIIKNSFDNETLDIYKFNNNFGLILSNLKNLQKSLTVVQKCAIEDGDKTLVINTCMSVIVECSEHITETMSQVVLYSRNIKDDKTISETELVTNEIICILKTCRDIIETKRALKESICSKNLKHLNETQKSVFNLKIPINSLLHIVKNALEDNVLTLADFDFGEVILLYMSSSIQDLQTALEHIESLSVDEDRLTLNNYNTLIINTVMDSVLKLRTSFEKLSSVTKMQHTKKEIKNVLVEVKVNLDEISSLIHDIEANVGQLDVLHNDNKLEILQKMAQTFISMENNMFVLNNLPDVKSNMLTFHKNLTKILETIIENNEPTKYVALMQICDGVNKINIFLKNIETDRILSLTSIGNILSVISEQINNIELDDDLCSEIINNINQLLKYLQYTADSSIDKNNRTDSDQSKNFNNLCDSGTERKTNSILHHIENTIIALQSICMDEESTAEIQILRPVVEKMTPVLEDLKYNIASYEQCVELESHLSDLSQISLAKSINKTMEDLHQSVTNFNLMLLDSTEIIKPNSSITNVLAKPIFELNTALEILQEGVISQYVSLSSLDFSVKVASVTQVLQNCVLIVGEPFGCEAVEDVSTLDDVSCIRTTAESISSVSYLTLPLIQETKVEQFPSNFEMNPNESTVRKILQICKELDNDITELQSFQVIETLQSIVDQNNNSDLREVINCFGDLKKGVECVLHNLIVESSQEMPKIITEAKHLFEIVQKVHDKMSGVNIEELSSLEDVSIPFDKTKKSVPYLTKLKNDIEEYIQVTSEYDSNMSFDSNDQIETIRTLCEDLRVNLKLTETQADSSKANMKAAIMSLQENLDVFLKSTVKGQCHGDTVKQVTESLYLEMLNLEDKLSPFTPQSPSIIESNPIITIADEIIKNIAVRYEIRDFSIVSDICDFFVVPTSALGAESFVFENVLENTAKLVQDNSCDLSLTDLKILEDFFQKCRDEFDSFRYLLRTPLSNKKVIRLLQEYYLFHNIINNFKPQQSNLVLTGVLKNCLESFLIQISENLNEIQLYLITIIESQKKKLFSCHLEKIKTARQTFSEHLHMNESLKLHEIITNFLEVIEIAQVHFDGLEQAVKEELQSHNLLPLNPEDNILINKLDIFETFIETQIDRTSENDFKLLLEKLFECLKKHQEYKDARGTAKKIIILKCISECIDLLNKDLSHKENVLSSVPNTELKTLITVMADVLRPMQMFNGLLITVFNDMSSNVNVETIQKNETSMRTYIENITNNSILLENYNIEDIQINQGVVTGAAELEKEINLLQNNLQSLENLEKYNFVDTLFSSIKEIEQFVHSILLSTGSTNSEGETRNTNDISESLLRHIEQYIEVTEIVEEISAVLNIENIKETAKIANELRESLATTEMLPETENQSFEGTIADSRKNLAIEFQKSLIVIHDEANGSSREPAGVQEKVMEVITLLREDLNTFTSQANILDVSPNICLRERDGNEIKTVTLSENEVLIHEDTSEKPSELGKEALESSSVLEKLYEIDNQNVELHKPIDSIVSNVEDKEGTLKYMTQEDFENSQIQNVNINNDSFYHIHSNSSFSEEFILKTSDVCELNISQEIQSSESNVEDINFITLDNKEEAKKINEIGSISGSIDFIEETVEESMHQNIPKKIKALQNEPDFNENQVDISFPDSITNSQQNEIVENNEPVRGDNYTIQTKMEKDNRGNQNITLEAKYLDEINDNISKQSDSENNKNSEKDIAKIQYSELKVFLDSTVFDKPQEYTELGKNKCAIRSGNLVICSETEKDIGLECEHEEQPIDVLHKDEDNKSENIKHLIDDEKITKCDCENSIQRMEILIKELNANIDFLNHNNTFSYKDTIFNILDEFQMVIIKLKCDCAGDIQGTLNETLEDLECSVRSVQLQISENSPTEHLQESSMSIQLLVNNLKDVSELLLKENLNNEKTDKILLKDCGECVECTIKIIEKGFANQSNIQEIIDNLYEIKEIIKSIKQSISIDTEKVIDKGVDIIQDLNLIENKLIRIEKELAAKDDIEPQTQDAVITAVHSTYESISNIRDTISRTQKRYLYKNYGVPSENILKAIKIINYFREIDGKQNWLLLSKCLRKFLNHFEDIKFYVNLDKTARLPSNCLLTVDMLTELNTNLLDIMFSNMSNEWKISLGDPVKMIVYEINKILQNLENRSCIEVREKIPIFIEISEKIFSIAKDLREHYEKKPFQTDNYYGGIEDVLPLTKRVKILDTSTEFKNEHNNKAETKMVLEIENEKVLLNTEHIISKTDAEFEHSITSEVYNEDILLVAQDIVQNLIKNAVDTVMSINQPDLMLVFETNGSKTEINELNNNSETKIAVDPHLNELSQQDAAILFDDTESMKIENLEVININEAEGKSSNYRKNSLNVNSKNSDENLLLTIQDSLEKDIIEETNFELLCQNNDKAINNGDLFIPTTTKVEENILDSENIKYDIIDESEDSGEQSYKNKECFLEHLYTNTNDMNETKQEAESHKNNDLIDKFSLEASSVNIDQENQIDVHRESITETHRDKKEVEKHSSNDSLGNTNKSLNLMDGTSAVDILNVEDLEMIQNTCKVEEIDKGYYSKITLDDNGANSILITLGEFEDPASIVIPDITKESEFNILKKNIDSIDMYNPITTSSTSTIDDQDTLPNTEINSIDENSIKKSDDWIQKSILIKNNDLDTIQVSSIKTDLNTTLESISHSTKTCNDEKTGTMSVCNPDIFKDNKLILDINNDKQIISNKSGDICSTEEEKMLLQETTTTNVCFETDSMRHTDNPLYMDKNIDILKNVSIETLDDKCFKTKSDFEKDTLDAKLTSESIGKAEPLLDSSTSEKNENNIIECDNEKLKSKDYNKIMAPNQDNLLKNIDIESSEIENNILISDGDISENKGLSVVKVQESEVVNQPDEKFYVVKNICDTMDLKPITTNKSEIDKGNSPETKDPKTNLINESQDVEPVIHINANLNDKIPQITKDVNEILETIPLSISDICNTDFQASEHFIDKVENISETVQIINEPSVIVKEQISVKNNEFAANDTLSNETIIMYDKMKDDQKFDSKHENMESVSQVSATKESMSSIYDSSHKRDNTTEIQNESDNCGIKLNLDQKQTALCRIQTVDSSEEINKDATVTTDSSIQINKSNIQIQTLESVLQASAEKAENVSNLLKSKESKDILQNINQSDISNQRSEKEEEENNTSILIPSISDYSLVITDSVEKEIDSSKSQIMAITQVETENESTCNVTVINTYGVFNENPTLDKTIEETTLKQQSKEAMDNDNIVSSSDSSNIEKLELESIKRISKSDEIKTKLNLLDSEASIETNQNSNVMPILTNETKDKEIKVKCNKYDTTQMVLNQNIELHYSEEITNEDIVRIKRENEKDIVNLYKQEISDKVAQNIDRTDNFSQKAKVCDEIILGENLETTNEDPVKTRANKNNDNTTFHEGVSYTTDSTVSEILGDILELKREEICETNLKNYAIENKLLQDTGHPSLLKKENIQIAGNITDNTEYARKRQPSLNFPVIGDKDVKTDKVDLSNLTEINDILKQNVTKQVFPSSKNGPGLNITPITSDVDEFSYIKTKEALSNQLIDEKLFVNDLIKSTKDKTSLGEMSKDDVINLRDQKNKKQKYLKENEEYNNIKNINCEVSHSSHLKKNIEDEPLKDRYQLSSRRDKPYVFDPNIHSDLDFSRPPAYIPKPNQPDDFTNPLMSSIGSPSTVFYKAQSLVRDFQLRSSIPYLGVTDMDKQPETYSKSSSESKHLIKQKRMTVGLDLKRKPTFSTQLTNRTAVEGSRVKLTCSVLSPNETRISWFKNDILLDNKHKYKIKCIDGLITIEILNVVPSDSGDYCCTLENDYGTVKSCAKLKVYPSFEPSPIPPTFTRSIRDTYNGIENELVLECRIRGQPLPTITWLKDNKQMTSDERIHAVYLADGVCRLTISRPNSDDSGNFTCRAENSLWSDQISHYVSFAEKHICTKEESKDIKKISHVQDIRRPHFTNVLNDYKVVKGGTIGLQVEIGGAPTLVEWIRDGAPVTDLYRNAQTFVDHGIYTLALHDVSESHSGLYTCRAWSSHGNVDMNADITVVQPNAIEGKPAVFVSRPNKDVLNSIGEDVNISFRVQGEPKPKVIFMKGIRDITNSQRVCKMTSDDYVKFTLKRTVISDAGTYCILARNTYGCDRAFVTVVVRQRASSENLISDWTYPTDDTALITADRNFKSLPGRIPGEPTVVDGGSNWISLAWPKPDPNSAAPVLAYKVDSWLVGKEGGARWTEMGITPRNTFDAFNLKQGEEYQFRVTPRNRYGWGEPVQTSTPVGVLIVGDRPEFTDILPGLLKVLVGETAKLDCKFKGKPTPEIVWMRNGHEIEEGLPRVGCLQTGNQCSLTIKNVQIDDEGRYSCEATNTHGRASTYSRMAIITDKQIWEADAKLKRERSSDAIGEYPPQFTMRLRDRRVQSTHPVRLTCQIIGNPTPCVTWYKDGQEVVFDRRRVKYQDEHFHTLEIAPTTLDDDGLYEALARNSRGAVSCRCSLVVDKGIRAYIAPEYCCGLEPFYRLNEGDQLRISAVVEAYPSVGVTWYRDGVRLRASRRAVMTLDRDGQIELALASVTRRDAGVYTCTVSNEVGQASTSGKVEIVSGDVKEDNVPTIVCSDVPYSKEPMFIKKPRSTEAQEGDTVIIECEVIGDPKPDVYWLRDFLKPDYYRDASHFRRAASGPQYRFEIPHAKLDFTGAYSVVAHNIHGETKAIISLQIFAKIEDASSSEDSHNITYGRVEVIPKFEKELTDLLCYDGDAVEFECEVSGNPEPDIRWMHYNKTLPDCPDLESSYELGTARLRIRQVTAEDEGTYVCHASNNLGQASTRACLVVYPPGEPHMLSQRLQRPAAMLSTASTPRSTPRTTPRTTPARSLRTTPGRDVRHLRSPTREIAPKFYTYPFNKVVEEGDTVVFQCAVAGLPPPWATWDKDGLIITPSSRITIKEKDDMLRILQIEQVSIEDVGLYRIALENEYGRAEASARLEVITQSGKFYGGVRSSSASPRRSIYRRTTPH